jgi:hypothetical protein
MASIKEAFGEYKPNKSKVYFDAPVSLGELLDRLAAGGVPMAHTLSEFHKNPEAPATEFVQNATDEVLPFKYQLRTGQATPESMAKEAVLLAAPVPKKRGYVQVDNAATKAFNDMIREMAEGPMPRGTRPSALQELRELADMNEPGAYKDYVTDLAEGVPWEYNHGLYQALDMIKKKYPKEYRNIILEDWDRFAKQPDKYTNIPVEEHFEPNVFEKYGSKDPTSLENYGVRFNRKSDSPTSIQFTIGELEDALQSGQVKKAKLDAANKAMEKIIDNLND